MRGALRAGVLVCVLCALGAFGVAEGAFGLALVFAVTGAAGWWLTEWRPSRGAGAWRGLPRWITNLLLIMIVAFAVFSAFGSRSLVTTFATLLASVLVVKLWQERRAADYGQLLTMSLFLTVAAVLSDNSVATGVMVLVQTPAMVASAMLYQVWAVRARAGGPEQPPAAERAAWRRLRFPFVAVVCVTLGAGAAVAVPVFVVMPRGYLLPQFRSFAHPGVGRTVGFTDQIDLSAGAPQEESTVVVMDVQVRPGGNELEASGSGDRPVYLRGAVLDTYSNGRWSASPTPASMQKHEELQLSAGRASIEQVIPGSFTQHAVAVRPRVSLTERAQAFSVGRGYRWEFVEQVVVQLDQRTGTLTYERGAANSPYRVDCTAAPVNPWASQRGLVSFPEGRVRAYAEALLRAADIEPDPALRDPSEDARVARVFETHLRTRFSYSRRAGVPPIEQPVAWFLETEKQGHCEFFASALAGLCRSVGIEANVVAGYLATEYDPAGGENGMGAYTVRASDAHAWVEVCTQPGVWATYDATPEANPGFRDRQRGALATVIDRFMWAVEDVWNARVVSYDKSTQERLLGVNDRAGGFAGLITSFFDQSQRQRVRGAALSAGRFVPLLAGCAVVAGAVWWAVRRLRRAANTGDLPGWAALSHPEAAGLARAVAAVLARHGVVRAPGVPLRVVVRAATLPGPTSAALTHAAALLYEACFAGRADADAMARAREALRRAG